MKNIFSFGVESANSSVYANALNAQKRVQKGVSKLPLKNLIKVIDAKVKKVGRGEDALIGSLTLEEALRACRYSAFSTSLLTFMDKERTKLVALYEAKKEKEESVLGQLVKESYTLVDDSDLGAKVTETYEHLVKEEQKAKDALEKRAKAREAEVGELKNYFAGLGYSENDALTMAQKCRIIKATIKDGRAYWAEKDLYASWAFTKATELSAWEEEKAAYEAQLKAEKEAKREANKAKKEAKANKKAEAYEMAKKSLRAFLGRELTKDEETRMLAEIA